MLFQLKKQPPITLYSVGICRGSYLMLPTIGCFGVVFAGHSNIFAVLVWKWMSCDNDVLSISVLGC